MNWLLKPILLIAMLIAGAAAAQSGDRATITVTAEGKVTAAPDMAYVYVGVVERAATADEALEAMSLSAARVLERLQDAGIAPADIQTGQVSLSPYYGSSSLDTTPTVEGFEANTTLNVRVRDLPILGKVLDAVVEDGANQLGGIRFDISEPEPLLDEARRAAVRAARQKAALFAEAADVDLGALLSLTEAGGPINGPVAMEMRMMDAMSAVPVAEGEVSLSASVTLVYAIAE